MKNRTAQIERKSKETEIIATVNVDGKGNSKIKTQIGLLDHMLDLFAFHGFFDLTIEVQKADLEIDIHHTNEDVGIVLGKLFRKALEELKGIKRFGVGFSPMESTLGRSVVDISGRSFLALKVGDSPGDLNSIKDQEEYSMKYLEHFMESFANGLGATINLTIENPDADLHTNVETIFKSLGQALDQATSIDSRREGEVPSTKGIID